MRRIQGGNKIFGKCWVVLVAVTGMLCVMLSDASMRALGDDSFVTASDSVDSSGSSAHLNWKNPTQTRQVDFVDAEQIPVPPPPAGQDYDDSSVRLQPLSPAIAPDSGHVLDSGDLSGDWASGDCTRVTAPRGTATVATAADVPRISGRATRAVAAGRARVDLRDASGFEANIFCGGPRA